MARAREAILRAGGAARANVFTRFALALFGQVPWRAVPVMPAGDHAAAEAGRRSISSKVSYWSRTVIVPLLVADGAEAAGRRTRARVDIRELFVTPPEQERHYLINPTGSAWGKPVPGHRQGAAALRAAGS